jgi:hypothetical protein
MTYPRHLFILTMDCGLFGPNLSLLNYTLKSSALRSVTGASLGFALLVGRTRRGASDGWLGIWVPHKIGKDRKVSGRKAV